MAIKRTRSYRTDNPVEIRAAHGFPGYFISDDGRVFRELKTHQKRSGYVSIGMTDLEGHTRWPNVHRLLLESFIGPEPNLQAAHQNGIRSDNRLENLRWMTPKENYWQQEEHGSRQHGENHYAATLTWTAVEQIRKRTADGERQIDLAVEFAVNDATINNIVHGRKWAL